MAKSNKSTKSNDVARKIWLAGIGAYGRAFSDAQLSLAKMGGDTSKLFDDLVEKGEEIEETVEGHGKKLAKKVKAQNFSIDDRIQQMRKRLMTEDQPLPIPRMPVAQASRIDALEAKLDTILEILDQQNLALEALQSSNTASGTKRTTKKSATPTKRKSTSKRKTAASKKTTAKTTRKKTSK